MAKSSNTDFFANLRSQGIRKRVARALSDLEGSSRGARGNAEKVARRVINDLRSAADSIEKRLDIGGTSKRSAAGKKAAKTRKRKAAKRSSTAKKAATTRARKSTSAKKTTARKTGARKATGARKTARRAPRKRS